MFGERYFWHPLIRKSTSSTGSLLLEYVCGIKRKNRLYSIGNTFLVFFLSGLVHYMVEGHWIVREGGRYTLWWWSLQALVITIEEAVQMIYLSVKPRLEQTLGFRVRHGWEKAVGYLWVFLFMFCSIPRAEYVKYREMWNL